MNQLFRHAEQQTGEGDNYSRSDDGGRRRSVEWLRNFFFIFQLLLLRVWETCKKSEQLLPVTWPPRTNPPPPSTTAASPLHYTREQSTNDTLEELSKFKNMVFAGLVAILCGVLSLNLGSNTTTTRFLIRSCNFATVVGSICIIASTALPFILPRQLWLAKLLFFTATGLLSICILLCSLLVHDLSS